MSENGNYECPYPDCDWQISRSVDSDNPLTRCVVKHKIRKHRCEHTGKTYDPSEGL